MQYKEFVREMFTRSQETLKEDYEIREEEILQCNDIRDRKLTFVRKGKRGIQAAPSVSMKGFFEMYEMGVPIEKCERVLLCCIEEAEDRCKTEEWKEAVSSWEKAKKYVYPILLSKERNREFLKDLVWHPFLDLAVCYMLVFSIDEGQGNIKIKREHLAQWGIKEQELVEQAEKNNLKQNYSLKDMGELCSKILIGSKAGEKEKLEYGGMYVLSNLDNLYGAAKLLCKPFLEKISDGQSFYILPSSVHESILVSDQLEIPRKALNEMVREVNSTMVAEEAENVGLEGRKRNISNHFGGVQRQGTLNKDIRRITQDCNEAQLSKKSNSKVLLPKFSCYSLRHTFTARLVEEGVNIFRCLQILLRQSSALRLHHLYHTLRPGDADICPDAEHPAQELGAYGDVYICSESAVILGDHTDVLTETVDQDARDVLLCLQGDASFFTTEHPEHLSGICSDIQ